MSPTSSRNSVPPSACSNLPARSANAPVNDPFMWPNSSLSISSDGIAAQLTSTNASSRRGDASCSARATSSLPVPFSPVISTRAAVGPTLADQLPHVLERGTPAHHRIAALGDLPQAGVLADELGVRQRVPHGHQQPVGIERLLEEVERAALGRLDRGGDGAVPGDHDDLRAGVEIAKPGQRLQAVEPGHLHVEKDEVGTELGVDRDRLAAGRRHADLQLLVLQHLLQRLPDAGFVVDDQDPMTHGRGAP